MDCERQAGETETETLNGGQSPSDYNTDSDGAAKGGLTEDVWSGAEGGHC